MPAQLGTGDFWLGSLVCLPLQPSLWFSCVAECCAVWASALSGPTCSCMTPVCVRMFMRLLAAAAEGAAASSKLAGTPEAQAAQAMAEADRAASSGSSKAPVPRPAPLSRRLISRNSSFVGGLSEDEIEVHPCPSLAARSCCTTGR